LTPAANRIKCGGYKINSYSGGPPLVKFDDCPCSGRTLGKLTQPAILTVLAQGPVHGYRIVERVAGMALFHGERPDTTGVYRLLKTMEDRGVVVSAWDLSDSGPARRTYRLTAAGRACLRLWVTTLSGYQKAIGELLKAARGAAGKGRACCPAAR
jgi:DNA-binding PadR family transcriptional regulator